jgi:hypothetical protein
MALSEKLNICVGKVFWIVSKRRSNQESIPITAIKQTRDKAPLQTLKMLFQLCSISPFIK